jgi:ATP-binding cassette subfamily C (CFTR/MRP) protein 1
MLGFTTRLTEIIQNLRVRELNLSTRFRKLLLVRVFFGKVEAIIDTGLY